MTVWSQIVPWILILIPFVVLAYSYDSLADPVLIARDFFGDGVIVAPKSLFTVFRVPLIEVVCAAAIEVMRRRAHAATSKTDAEYYLFWTILLYTVAAKSMLQTTETLLRTDSSKFLTYVTLGAVVIGVLAAVIAGRRLLSNLKNVTSKVRPLELAALATLLIMYAGLALAPVYIFG